MSWFSHAWYYFRLGYELYLTFLLGYFSTLVTIHYLAIRNMPFLFDLLPHFGQFAVVATVVGIPICVAVGWIDLRRSGLYSSEQDVTIESNRYYKLAPVVSKEARFPLMLMELRLIRKLSESAGLLTDSERGEIEELEKKWAVLLADGCVGLPRWQVNF